VADTDNLYSAKRDYQQVKMMRDLLDQGISTGFGANITQKIGEAGVKFGWVSPDKANVIANTQVYGQLAASRMAELARKFNTRGLTVADQKFVQAAAASDYTWTPAALKRALDVTTQMIQTNATEHNRRVQGMKSWDEDTRNANLVDIGAESASVPQTNGGDTKTFIMPDGSQVVGTLDAGTGRYKGTYKGALGWLN
jgi:hypothetical protein